MRDEIAIHDKNAALQIVNILVDEEYCVMISREEDLYVINYIYSEYSDRNNVVFMNKEEFDTDYYQRISEDNDN